MEMYLQLAVYDLFLKMLALGLIAIGVVGWLSRKL